MSGIHLFQVFLILHLSNNFSLLITYTTPVYDSITNNITPVSETLLTVKIGPLVVMFLFISAATHILIATALYDRYVKNLKNHINPF